MGIRLDPLKRIGPGVLALAAILPAAAPRADAESPNILLIIADDQAWHDSACYGNKEVHTPNIDRLAGQGMRFARAFTATAMCSPTRQQLYTGIFPVRNGAYPNHSKVKPGSVSEAMIQYVDFVPTCIEAASGRKVEGLDGRSFLPVLLGKTDEHHDAVYGVHTTRGIIAGTPCYPIRSIRTETHKLILNLNHKEAFHNVLISGDREKYWHSWVEKAKTDEFAARRVDKYQHRPAEELYDVVNDPYEMNNLAGDPKQRPLMDELRRKLQAWMEQQEDGGIETELAGRRGKKKSRR